MFAIIAAICFAVAFLFAILGISFGALGAFALVCLGLFFMALAHGAFGGLAGGRLRGVNNRFDGDPRT